MNKNLENPPFAAESQQELWQLSKNIKLARRRRKITLAEMAKRTGSSVSTISRLESGDARVSIAVLLNTLGILGLLKGLAMFIAPENDRAALNRELQKFKGDRKPGQKGFDKSELNF